MGVSTISMAIFNSYADLPVGISTPSRRLPSVAPGPMRLQRLGHWQHPLRDAGGQRRRGEWRKRKVVLNGDINDIWLVVWNILYFPMYWEFHHPNWLIFFRGVETTNQYTTIQWWTEGAIFRSVWGVHIPDRLPLNNGEPVGATNRVSQPSKRQWGCFCWKMVVVYTAIYPLVIHLEKYPNLRGLWWFYLVNTGCSTEVPRFS